VDNETYPDAGSSQRTRRLSWPVLLWSFAFYLITLSHGVTATSLPLAARVAGWDWTPMVGLPVLWLLTLPLRLLPAAWVPLGLNIFSAATAALTLGLLARTVQLLPWDKPREAVDRPVRAVAAALACVLCGLEFSFWQEAAAATGEMLDLLLLAAALWLLLEYRVNRDSRWLYAAAVVWGLGMAENWLMLLALPLFIAGVIQLRGLHFFRIKFLLRMAGLGLAGFSIYALLPLVNGLMPDSPWSFGQSWLASLKQTKYMFALFYYQFWVIRRLLTLVVLFYFLVPALSCLVRLRRDGTSYKTEADRFQFLVFQWLRVLLLLACVWLAFDPLTGPRQIVQRQFGVALPLLTFDYLNALGAGFLAGNLLLLARGAISHRGHSRRQNTRWRRLAIPVASGLLVLLIAGLMARNIAAVLSLNLHPLQRYGELVATSLPDGPGAVLSSQPQKLEALQAALAHRRDRKNWLAVDLHALPAVAYRARLERRQPAGWLTDRTRHELAPAEMVRLLEQIARTNRLFYLHPGYGFLFEQFYLEPAGPIYEMKVRGQNFWDQPGWSDAALDSNEVFWNGVWQKELAPLVVTSCPRQNRWQKITERFGLTPAPRNQERLLAGWFSVSLDAWGVALQRQNRWPAARQRFEQALQLNSNNLAARINLAGNTNLQSGARFGLAGVDRVAGQLRSFQHLSGILNNNGPFDEPVFCYLLGCAFQKNGLLLQAAEQLERTRALIPDSLAPEFILAEIYTRLQCADRARPIIEHLRAEIQKLPARSALDLDVALLEANSWLLQTNPANASTVLQSVLRRYPDNEQIANRLIGAYLAYGDFTNALQLVNARLSRSPDDIASLNNQAVILIVSGHASNAIPILDRLLTLTNLPEARLNRANARIACQDYAGAEEDYRQLENARAEPGRVSLGLAMIAEHRRDTNQVLHYLRFCLTNTPAGTPLWRQANTRLQSLESSSHPSKNR
jgi:tetratricopeptide (TPR) repeat protein